MFCCVFTSDKFWQLWPCLTFLFLDSAVEHETKYWWSIRKGSVPLLALKALKCWQPVKLMLPHPFFHPNSKTFSNSSQNTQFSERDGRSLITKMMRREVQILFLVRICKLPLPSVKLLDFALLRKKLQFTSLLRCALLSNFAEREINILSRKWIERHVDHCFCFVVCSDVLWCLHCHQLSFVQMTHVYWDGLSS